MCNLSWTPHSNLEKDNSLNHSWTVLRAIPHWRAYMAKTLILFQQDETFTGDVKNM